VRRLVSWDVLVARAKWPVVVANECSVFTSDGALVAHARAIDVRGWDRQLVFADLEHTREILRFDRPDENRRLQPVHEGIPRADLVYRVFDGATNAFVGSVQRSWAARSLRDRWLLRDADWVEQGRMEEASAARALARTLVTSLPRSYVFRGAHGELGTARRSWDIARVSASLDLRADTAQTLDRRLLLVVAILLLFR
jgi:hypothetical protein